MVSLDSLSPFLSPDTFAFALSAYLIIRTERTLQEIKEAMIQLSANCNQCKQNDGA